ncbi:MAG: SdpI family protein [Bacteroidota bacterium]
MPIELKISISLFLISISIVLLRGNRNWIFGYRSPRAIRTHKHYAYANTIYGIGMFLISGVYLAILTWSPRIYKRLTETEHILIAVVYFAVLFLIIELNLRKTFKE